MLFDLKTHYKLNDIVIIGCGAIIISCCALFSNSTLATTLMGMDIDDIAQRAELIFEGEVINIQAQLDSSSGIINTFVTFQVIDLIKGDLGGSNLELKFSGGELDGEIVEVSGSTLPMLGEAGIYFVESTSRDMLNPLLGWSQGHFLIKNEGGQRRVHTVSNNPVTQVQSVSAIPRAIKAPNLLIQNNEGIAAGVTTRSRTLAGNQALSVADFKQQILDLIKN
ncbi:MAG: hypothetical protein ACJA2Q_001249 [Pseudohongiellaceae bacterium]|jgi:hypothetical protein